MTIDRRKWVLGASSLLMAQSVLAQTAHHHGTHHPALPKADPSSEPYAKLQGGVPHHLTADQESQRSVKSPAPKGPPDDGSPVHLCLFLEVKWHGPLSGQADCM